MKTSIKVLATALTASLAVTAFAACGGNKNYAENNESFFIATSGPLTGDYAKYGLGVKNSAELAVEEINKVAKDELGFTFTFSMADDKASPDEVNSKYYNFYEKGMQVSLGTVTTGACLEWKALATNDSLFCITPSATGDKVYSDSDIMYQMCFSDNNQGTAAAKYVKDSVSTTKKVGVFYQSDDEYSAGIYSTFTAEMGSGSGYEMATATFTKDSKTDFASQANTLKDCEFVFLPIYYSDAATFMLAANKIDNKITQYYGCDGLDGIDSYEGFDISTIPQEISYLTHFNSSAESGKAKEFIDKYVAKYGTDTLNQFGASAYDCIYAIYTALKNAKAEGKDVKVNMSASEACEIFKAQFSKMTVTDYVTGSTIKWNADGTVNKPADRVVVKAASK
ncbi:MAG: ABC transporter substrate-binding protein [Clostridia bacterium]|nr:ABC transporter substrate-binding protein [Clostridia bacterium]